MNQVVETSAGANHENFEFVQTCITAGVNPLLVGPAGCGKTTIARNVAKVMNLPFHYTGAVESSFQLKGFTDAQGRIVETSFVQAYRDGGVFLFDEMDASDPAALVAVHAALDNGIFDAPGGVIHRHMDFHFIAAANTWGHGATLDYMGRNHLDGATLDRFIPVAMDYDQAFEKKLVEEKFPNQTEWADTVHKARAAARDMSLRHIISTRAHLKGAALLDAGVSRDRVIDSVLLWGLEQDTKIKMISAMNRVIVPAMPLQSPQPTAPATSFIDARVGQYVPEVGGIYMGLWRPRNKNGDPVGIECELYADVQDLGGVHTYNDSVELTAKLDRNGRKGGHFKNQDEIIASLVDGTGIDKFFMPSDEILDGKVADATGDRVKIRAENLYDLKDVGAFAGTFITEYDGSDVYPHWYWSSTENRDYPGYVWNVDFSDGDDGFHHKGNCRLSSRPCFVRSVKHLTI